MPRDFHEFFYETYIPLTIFQRKWKKSEDCNRNISTIMPFLNTDNMVKNWQKRTKLTSDQTKLTAWFVVLAAGEPCNGFGPWPGKKEDILYSFYVPT